MRPRSPSTTRRIALAFPRVKYRTGDPPLGLAYLAAVLRRDLPHVDVRIVDGTFEGGERRFIQAVREVDADLVGAFTDHLSLPVACALAQACRTDGSFLLAGGPAATLEPERLVPPFDAALRGEGEVLLSRIVERVLSRAELDDVPNLVLRSDDAAPRHTRTEWAGPDLDSLPFPAWELLDMRRYLRLWPYLDSTSLSLIGTNLVASRGCSWQCAHCQPALSSLYGKRVRRRSPESVVAEIEELQRRYGVAGVFFHDDTLTANHRWLTELCDRLCQLPRPVVWGCNSRADLITPELVGVMARAGLRSIHVGIEAGSARVRDEVLHKRLDLDRLQSALEELARHRVHALGFFMLGSPTETVGEMLETIGLARRLPLTEATFSLTSALPGTHLYARVEADPNFKLLAAEAIDYYNQRNFSEAGSRIGERTLRVLQAAALAGFYTRPARLSYVGSHLITRRGREKLGMKVARFLVPFRRAP